MNIRLDRAIVALAALGLAAGCSSDVTPGSTGILGNIAVDIGALTVPGPAEVASYTIVVQYQDGEGVWQDFETINYDSEAGFEGAGAYVGTCLASETEATGALPSRAIITLNSAFDADGNDILASCEGPTQTIEYFSCIDAADAQVDASFSLLCDVARGFADITLDIDNAYCEAKIECVDALLNDPVTLDRGKTLVTGATCTKNFDDDAPQVVPFQFEIACVDGDGIEVDVTQSASYHHKEYIGRESLTNMVFSNSATLVTDLALAGAESCKVTAEAYVVQASLDADGNAIWPSTFQRNKAILKYSADLEINGATDAFDCSNVAVETQIIPLAYTSVTPQNEESLEIQFAAFEANAVTKQEPCATQGQEAIKENEESVKNIINSINEQEKELAALQSTLVEAAHTRDEEQAANEEAIEQRTSDKSDYEAFRHSVSAYIQTHTGGPSNEGGTICAQWGTLSASFDQASTDLSAGRYNDAAQKVGVAIANIGTAVSSETSSYDQGVPPGLAMFETPIDEWQDLAQAAQNLRYEAATNDRDGFDAVALQVNANCSKTSAAWVARDKQFDQAISEAEKDITSITASETQAATEYEDLRTDLERRISETTQKINTDREGLDSARASLATAREGYAQCSDRTGVSVRQTNFSMPFAGEFINSEPIDRVIQLLQGFYYLQDGSQALNILDGCKRGDAVELYLGDDAGELGGLLLNLDGRLNALPQCAKNAEDDGGCALRDVFGSEESCLSPAITVPTGAPAGGPDES